MTRTLAEMQQDLEEGQAAMALIPWADPKRAARLVDLQAAIYFLQVDQLNDDDLIWLYLLEWEYRQND